MAKITANNIQAGSITAASLSVALVSSISSASESGTKAQDAFDRANSANVLAQSAFDAANTVSPLDSFARQTANASFAQANTGTVLAQAAFNAANTVSPLDSFSRQTANAAFEQANTSTILAQAAFNAANNASGGGASGGIINLNMPGILNVPFEGTSRYYPTTSITLGTVYANLSASPSANLQFVILKNGANIGNSFIITTSSPVMTPVVLSGVGLTTSDYLTLNLLGSNILASELAIKIAYS
jgi:hypothetical protein